MIAFARLLAELERGESAEARVAALAGYLSTAPERDRLWLLALASGRRPRRIASAAELRAWATEAAGLPDWLFAESRALSGDPAETAALILPDPPAETPVPGLAETLDALAQLAGQPAETRRAAVRAAWAVLPAGARLAFTRLLTGSLRIAAGPGPATRALAQALARATGRPETDLAQALADDWTPASTGYRALVEGGNPAAAPFPFAQALALDIAPEALGRPEDWLAEWHWDGIRVQLVARPGAFALWSANGEPVTGRFPEFAPLADALPPGTVIEGVILGWDAASARPLPLAARQGRLARALTAKALRAAPARLLAHDLLELAGRDLRPLPLSARRGRLAALAAGIPAALPLTLAPPLAFADWPDLAARRNQARNLGAAGLSLRRQAAPWQAGATGDWRLWPPDPLSIAAVLIYAEVGMGRGPALYTFALSDGPALVPIARTGTGLTEAEAAELAAWVAGHTLERFGPVRRVPPELVFEIGFDAVAASPRRKSGLALQAPRILRWHRDGSATGTLAGLQAQLAVRNG